MSNARGNFNFNLNDNSYTYFTKAYLRVYTHNYKVMSLSLYTFVRKFNKGLFTVPL